MVKWQCVECGKPFRASGDAGEFGELLYTSQLKGQGEGLLKALNPIRRGGFLRSLDKVSAVCIQRDPDTVVFAHLQARRDNALNYAARSRQSFFQIRFTQMSNRELHSLYQAGHAPLGDVFYRDILEKTGVSEQFVLQQVDNRSIPHTPPSLPYYKEIIRVISPKRGVAAETPERGLLFRWLAADAPPALVVGDGLAEQSTVQIAWVDRIVEKLLTLPSGGQLHVVHENLSIGARLLLMQAAQRLALPILGLPVTFALDVVVERSRHVPVVQFVSETALQQTKAQHLLRLTDADSQTAMAFTAWWRKLAQQGVNWQAINARWFTIEPLLRARKFGQAQAFLLKRYPVSDDAAQWAAFLIDLHCSAESDQTPSIISQQYPHLTLAERERLLHQYSAEILGALAGQTLSAEKFEAWGAALHAVPPTKLQARHVTALRSAFTNCVDAQQVVCRADTAWTELGAHVAVLLRGGRISADTPPNTRRALTVWLMRLLKTEPRLLPKLVLQELPHFVIEDADDAATYYQQLQTQIAPTTADDWGYLAQLPAHQGESQKPLNWTLRFLLQMQVKLTKLTDAALDVVDLVQLLKLQGDSVPFISEKAAELLAATITAETLQQDVLVQTLHLLTRATVVREDVFPLLHAIRHAPQWEQYRQTLLAREDVYDFSAETVSRWLQKDDSTHIVFHTLVWLPTANRVNWQLLRTAAVLPDIDEAFTSYQHLLATSRHNDMSGTSELAAWLNRRDNLVGSFHKIGLPTAKSNHLFFLAMWEWLCALPVEGALSADVQTDVEKLHKRAVAARLPDVQSFGSHNAETVLFLTQNYTDKEASLRDKALAALFQQPHIIEPTTWRQFFTNQFGFRVEDYLQLLTALNWSAEWMAIGLNADGIIDAVFETFGNSVEMFTFLQQYVAGGYSTATLATICQRIAQLPDVTQRTEQYQFWILPYAHALNRQPSEQLDLRHAAAQQPNLFKQLYDFVTSVEHRADFKLPTDGDFEWRQALAQNEQKNKRKTVRLMLLIGVIVIGFIVAFYFLRSN